MMHTPHASDMKVEHIEKCIQPSTYSLLRSITDSSLQGIDTNEKPPVLNLWYKDSAPHRSPQEELPLPQTYLLCALLQQPHFHELLLTVSMDSTEGRNFEDVLVHHHYTVKVLSYQCNPLSCKMGMDYNPWWLPANPLQSVLLMARHLQCLLPCRNRTFFLVKDG